MLYALLIRHSILHGSSPVLCNLGMFQRLNHTPFKLSEVKFRDSSRGASLIFIHPSLLYVLNDNKSRLPLVLNATQELVHLSADCSTCVLSGIFSDFSTLCILLYGEISCKTELFATTFCKSVSKLGLNCSSFQRKRDRALSHNKF